MRTVKILTVLLLVTGFLAGLPLLLRLASVPLEEFLALPKAVLVWPAAVALLGLVLLLRFHGAIDHVIRHGRFKFPGGVQIDNQPPEPPARATAEDGPGAVTLTPEQQAQVAELIRSLQDQSTAASAEVQRARELLGSTFRNAVLWEFRFLDVFFVPVTKQVLFWFSHRPRATRTLYESTWKTIIADAEQREIIVDVLLSHEVLSERNGQLEVTPKGLALLEFLGFQPQPVPHPPGRPGG